MDAEEFRQHGYKMVDYIINYFENIRKRPVVHKVRPGYMKKLLPKEAPTEPEDFADVFKDIEDIIMPGITHWHSPQFHGYFAAGNSFPSILGDMLSDAIGCIGFSWAASPACTELEVVTTDWLGKMIGLPEEFLHCHANQGGGVIQSTASESVFLCLLAARSRKITKLREENPSLTEHALMPKLAAYTSDQANSSVWRSGLLGAVLMRRIESDDQCRLRGEALRKAIEEDKTNGLIPFFVCASLGTTGSCAFDKLDEIGPLCAENDIWLHVDAAYAGSAFVCPEFRHFMEGIEFVETFSTNPHKWMLVNFDCSVMWIKHSRRLVDAFNVDPIYLRHENEGRIPDYRHWQIPLGRRFRALKLWFTIRTYGVTGIQAYIRRHVRLAFEFEKYVLNDGRFELAAETVMGLVCFRLKGPNRLSEKLLSEILDDGRIYLIPAITKNKYYLRLAVCAERTTSKDIQLSFDVIRSCANKVVQGYIEGDQDDMKAVIDIDEPYHDNKSSENVTLNNSHSQTFFQNENGIAKLS